MSWRVANSLIQLRKQVNEAFPARDKSSDGSIGDTAHSNRASDHNPNGAGVVTAIDVDRDFNDGHDGRQLVSALVASKDPRVKYIIFERQITVPGDISRWKPYVGKNAHNHHVHISVSADSRLYDDATAWNLDFAAHVEAPNVSAAPAPALLKKGSKGDGVLNLQRALAERGYLKLTDADGDFGPKTEVAVKNFQSANRLQPDGIAGTMTLRALGL
jgi:hypothetical protein